MPPSSPRRSLTQPLWRSLQVGLAVLLTGVVLFVALTRTEVGRSGIRNRIETVFNQQFAGTLAIGTLRGSLVDNLVATDVTLKTPSGDVVASIDSIHAVPRWSSLLTAELSMRSLTVVRPTLSLHRDSSGHWNLARALQRRGPPDSNRTLDLTLASLELEQGRITTSRDGPAPGLVQKNWLFDYTRTRATDVSGSVFLQRSGTQHVLEIQSTSFALPELGLRTTSLSGRLEKTVTGWGLSGLDLSLDTTRIRGEGTLKRASASDRSAFVLDLKRSRIDNDELRTLVPRLPLAHTTTVEGTLRGTRGRVHADGVTITHNASFLTVDGTVRDAAPGLNVDVTVSESRLHPTDVREVWPGVPVLPSSQSGPISLTGTVRGTTVGAARSRRTFDLAASLVARSTHGTVRGSLQVDRPAAAPLSFQTSLDTKDLNLAPLTGVPALSSALNGHVEARGTGTGRDTLRSTLSVSLDHSRLAGRPLASADGEVTVSGSAAEGSLLLRQDEGGVLSLEGSVVGLDDRPRYTALLTSSALNLAPLGPNLPRTALNARLTLRTTGSDWRSLNGTAAVNVDSSSVQRGDSTIALPPHTVNVHLAKRTGTRPRLEVSGSLMHLTVDGTTLGPPLWATGRTWVGAFRAALRRERSKPAPSSSPANLEALSPSPDRPDPSALRAKTRAALARVPGTGPIEARASFRVHQPQLLHAWWPSFPREARGMEGEGTLTVGTDSLHASGRIEAALLKSGPRQAEAATARFELSTHLGPPLAESTRLATEFSARRVAVGSRALVHPAASLSYQDRSGTLRLAADSIGITDSVRVVGKVHITPRKNELQLRNVSLNIRGAEWTNQSPASLLAYSNALVVTPLILRRPHPQTPSLQRLRVGGTLSAHPTDTLSVIAENVYLPPFSQITGMPHTIGGDLNGELHLRGGWGQPQLTSTLSIRRLSYDRRLLGTAHLRARYDATSPDLRLSGSLTAEVTSTDSLPGPDLAPNGIRRVDPNRLSLTGRIRLPEWARAGASQRASALPPGETLDLSVLVDRADLFFFRYIFEERVSSVQGYVTGPVEIEGGYRDPIFEASLTFRDAAVTLPRYGLEYRGEGPVEVDERGIHPRDFHVEDDEGTATLNGSILFNDYQYFSFDLSARLDGLTVIDVEESENLPFYGFIRASGPLQLTGPLSDATLQSNSARTTPDSELYIPVSGREVQKGTGFIVFADSTGKAPDVDAFTRRDNILADRPEGVPTFVEGLNLDLNVIAPEESTVHLVFDPIVGDVVTVVGSGRVQLRRVEGDFSVYGNFNATGGTYLFTAGEVFVRRFSINEGTITWDGNPTNAKLDLNAQYQTRASPSGLPGFENFRGRIPVTVRLHITGRVATPQVDLSLSLTDNQRGTLVGSESLNAILNQPARTTEYATSVLLTNTFLLTTESITQAGSGGEQALGGLTTAGNQLAFNSVSQLVSSQLNRYLGKALPNVDLNFGFQGEDPNNLDLIYGVALRLLNERLIIRGEGVYTGNDPDARQAEGPQGEFVVEIRLSSRVSANVFYRRTGDELTRNRALTSSRGAGLKYQTQFSNWQALFNRLFGWLLPDDSSSPTPVAQTPSPPADSIRAPGSNR